ncbi:MAG: hypothetical protein ACI4U3_02395 [Traorella sp.]
MSNEKFITDILNIELENIEKIVSIPQTDSSIKVRVRLKPKPDVCCPIGGH